MITDAATQKLVKCCWKKRHARWFHNQKRIKMAQLKHKTIKVSVKPCPCCGWAELDVGIQSCLTYGVCCTQCGLKLERQCPEKWPKGIWKRKDTIEANYERLMIYTLKQAIKFWNIRSSTDGQSVLKATIITTSK